MHSQFVIEVVSSNPVGQIQGLKRIVRFRFEIPLFAQGPAGYNCSVVEAFGNSMCCIDINFLVLFSSV